MLSELPLELHVELRDATGPDSRCSR
jgi:hypothetical protein